MGARHRPRGRPLVMLSALALLPACAESAPAGADASMPSAHAGGGAPIDAGQQASDEAEQRRPAEGAQQEPDATTCAAPSGRYALSLTAVSGDCGDVDDPSSFVLDTGRGGVSTAIVRRVDDTLRIEAVIIGCSLRLSVTIETPEGVLESELRGESLELGADGEITGTASFARFDEAGAASCSGTYSVVLSPDDATVGGAVGAPTDAGSDGATLDPALAAEVEADCTHTVMCRAQRGDPIVEDPITSCVEATTRILAGDPARQAVFRENRDRCREYVTCTYYDCVTSG